MLEQADDAQRQGLQQPDVERAERDAECGEQGGDCKQHRIHRQPGRDDGHQRQAEHHEAKNAHAVGVSPEAGVNNSASACSAISNASSQALSLTMK